jgi:hypothetical protein
VVQVALGMATTLKHENPELLAFIKSLFKTKREEVG